MKSLRNLINAGLILSGTSHAAIITMPIEILCPDADINTETVYVETGTSGTSATQLYLQVHNLRYQGQLSVRLNDKTWVDLTNTNPLVTFSGNDGKLGGIGGIQGTVRLKIKLDKTWTRADSQKLEFRFNGTDGHVTAVRILAIQLLNQDGANVITDTFKKDDPSEWLAPSGYRNPTAVKAGEKLWSLKETEIRLLNNPIEGATINASCASCHFEDGGDLRYFAYSNATILARAKFHGLTEEEGNQIAAFIRNASDEKYPDVGRPWNPPFQPWSDADNPETPENWAAGGGLESVVEEEKDALDDILIYGTDRVGIERVIDHEGRNFRLGYKNPPVFSIRKVRIPMQFPDWNMWLPRYAPEDIWENATDFSKVTQPFKDTYERFTRDVNNPLFNPSLMDTLDFISEIRYTNFGDKTNPNVAFRLVDYDLANDLGLSQARKAEFSREEMTEAVAKYQAVKTFNIVREFQLEDRAIQVLEKDSIRDGERSFPSSGSTVFDIAPHIGANNNNYRQGSTIPVGKLITNQWYHLQIVLNSGMRVVDTMNKPLDWDYQLEHLNDFYARTGINSGARVLATTLKMYQTRDNGNGVNQRGFSLRTLHPYNLQTPRSYNRDFLDTKDKGLWIRITEEFMQEWLDTMTQYKLSDSVKVPRTAETHPGSVSLPDRHSLPSAASIPAPWDGVGNPFADLPGGYQNHLDNTWRLIPILRGEGIDEGLLRDFAQWASKAWPGPTGPTSTNWDSLFELSPPTPGYGNRAIPKVLFLERFENVTAPTYPFTGMTGVPEIKDADYERTDRNGLEPIPKNGGGRVIGQTTLREGTASLVKDFTAALQLTSGVKEIRVRTRVAVQSFTTGSVEYAMTIGYNNQTQTAPALSLNQELSGWKFQTYEQTLEIPEGATSLTRITLQVKGDASTSGKEFYFDNVEVIEEPVIADTSPSKPEKPRISGLMTGNVLERNGEKNETRKYNSGIRLSWTKNAETENILGYKVYRSVNDGEWSSEPIHDGIIYADPGSTTMPVPKAFYTDDTVDPNTSYTYAVTAVSRSGSESAQSPHSNSLKLADTTIGKNDPPLSSPYVWIEPTTAGDIRWFASDELDCIGYHVYASESENPNQFIKLNSQPVTTFNFLDPTPFKGRKYYVQVVDGSQQEFVVERDDAGQIKNVNMATFDPYALWKQLYEDDSNMGGLDSMTASPAGDGIANLVKASLGISPLIAGYQGHLSTQIVTIGNTPYLTLTYTRPSIAQYGYNYTVEVSNDLENWSSSTADVAEISRVIAEGGVTTVTTRDLKTGGTRFIRLRVTSIP